jgi:hypothetical protein
MISTPENSIMYGGIYITKDGCGQYKTLKVSHIWSHKVRYLLVRQSKKHFQVYACG